jgi:hypothetical protein
MTWVLLTFVATTGLYAAVLIFALHRVALHLQSHPDAMRAVNEHILVPLLGKWHIAPDAGQGPAGSKETASDEEWQTGFKH